MCKVQSSFFFVIKLLYLPRVSDVRKIFRLWTPSLRPTRVNWKLTPRPDPWSLQYHQFILGERRRHRGPCRGQDRQQSFGCIPLSILISLSSRIGNETPRTKHMVLQSVTTYSPTSITRYSVLERFVSPNVKRSGPFWTRLS